MIEMAGATDTGLVRDRNEDAIKLVPDQGIAILSDGMGGHLAGNVASRVAIDVLAEELSKTEFQTSQPLPEDARKILISSMNAANSSIRAVAKSQPECFGMGATIAVCIIAEQVLVSHLGDSRVYLFCEGNLTQLTEDHTLAQKYLSQGKISKSEARSWSGRNLLMKGLGIESQVEPDISISELKHNSIYLLCSDGLTDVVTDDAIAQCLRNASVDLDRSVGMLIKMAIENGGPDNISVILIRTP